MPHHPSARNKVTGNWVTYAWHKVTSAFTDQEWTITVHQADHLDTVTNHTYEGAAFKVTVQGPPPADGSKLPRAKTFLGETAWSDAERYASDAHFVLQVVGRDYRGARA